VVAATMQASDVAVVLCRGVHVSRVLT
jgi:hypothetical protein